MALLPQGQDHILNIKSVTLQHHLFSVHSAGYTDLSESLLKLSFKGSKISIVLSVVTNVSQ